MLGIGIGLPLTPLAGMMSRAFGNRPTLDLNFMGGGFDSRITFARADAVTCATYFDSTGRMQRMGRNILTYSSTFTNAAWSKTDVTPALGESSPLDVGYLMTEGSAGTAIVQQAGAAVTAGSTITASLVLKRGNSDWIRFICQETTGTDGAQMYVNLATGAKGSVAARGAGTSVSGSVTPLGGGWYRCSLTCIPNGTYTVPATAVISATADGNGTRVSGATYTVSAAQLELGSTATSYSATTTAANSGPRFDYDPATPAGVTGPELVQTPFGVPGSFDNTVTAQTSTSFSTAGGTTASRVYVNTSATVVGKRYRVSGRVVSTSSGVVGVYARVGTGGTGATITSNASVSAGANFSIEWVAQTTQDSVLFVSGSTGVTFSVDSLTIAELAYNPRGLLIEESRQNLLLQSRDMTQAAWTKTDVTPARTQVGIDGVANTACLLTEGSAGTADLVQQPAAVVTAGATLTGSFVVKRGNTDWVRMATRDTSLADGGVAWFNLATGAKGTASAIGAGTNVSSAIYNLGGGWYRVTLTATPNGVFTQGSITLRSATADGSSTRVSGATYIVDCAQLEVGAFATSIIPTTTTALTRAADSASMTGTNFSSWWNATQGSFVAELRRFGFDNGAGSVGICQADDGTTNNRVALRLGVRASTAPAQQTIVAAGTINLNESLGLTTSIDGINVKAAIGYQVGVGATGRDGTIVNATSNPSLPTVTQLNIGQGPGAVALNGWIRSLRYYPTRLPNATLQALTA